MIDEEAPDSEICHVVDSCGGWLEGGTRARAVRDQFSHIPIVRGSKTDLGFTLMVRRKMCSRGQKDSSSSAVGRRPSVVVFVDWVRSHGLGIVLLEAEFEISL